MIRQSLNKALYTENTLPVIRQEKVNKVIYDSNVTTLPLIYAGKKVTYLSEAESQNYDFSSLLQQGATQEIVGQEYTNTQVIQGANYSLPQITKVEDYEPQIGQTQDYTQVSQIQNYSTQINQAQDFSQIIPEQQNIAYSEYQATNY